MDAMMKKEYDINRRLISFNAKHKEKYITPVLYLDGYKTSHRQQYPDGTTFVYSNMTPRSSRVNGVNEVVFFGMQYFIEKYLVGEFNRNFFCRPKEEVVAQYKRRMDNYLGKDMVPVDNIEALHDLGYLPITIKALKEGSLVPLKVPMFTIKNTLAEFFWLTNSLETLISNVIWMPCTSATTALQYLRTFNKFADETIGNRNFVPFQGHDFSYRGLAGGEAALTSGAGHLLSFFGTDTVPAIDLLEQYYGADSDKEMVGCSVPATEHSVMCLNAEYNGGIPDEYNSIRRLITKVHPTGIVSLVCDSFDFWGVLTNTLPKLMKDIVSRNGKLVVRPDSGDPVLIVCGDPNAKEGTPEHKGAVQCLWETFGGTVNSKGFKELDSHIGLIYGDSITLVRQMEILTRLKAKGFASSNVVLGIGSYTYQYVTRDTFGFAVKATAGIVNGEFREIYKDPKTDNGTKKSARGLLRVEKENGKLVLHDQQTLEQEEQGELQVVFHNGNVYNTQTLSEIRTRIQEVA